VPTLNLRAIALLRRPVRDADQLVTFLSAERGKVVALARGTRKPGSKLAAAVQPFAESDLMLASGRGTHSVLAQAQVIESHRKVRDNLRKLAHASYWVDLVARSVEEGQQAEGVFLLLRTSLRIASVAEDLWPATAYLQLHLLRLLGFEASSTQCAGCGRELEPGNSAWSVAAGGCVCTACTPLAPGARPMSSHALECIRHWAATRPTAAYDESLDRQAVTEAEGLVRSFVRYHIDAEPKALSFLLQVEGLPA